VFFLGRTRHLAELGLVDGNFHQVELASRLSIPCFYNLKSAHQEQVDQVTPTSTGQSPIDPEKHALEVSPAETRLIIQMRSILQFLEYLH
jgi:hypothetical protein